ncbi:amidophosphoribosyltransferase [bacterium]|nr:amidophosphoribosyltransferase [bacterium]
MSQDGWRDKCGVVGMWDVPGASELCRLALYALQHRGQESAGIVSKDRNTFYVVKDEGLVSDVFSPDQMGYLKGKAAIGHVRYSTTGESNLANVQPLVTKTSKGKIAVAHNGNLTNARTLYRQLKKDGALFQTTVDTEVILHLLTRSTHQQPAALFGDVLSRLEGAFSLVFLTETYLVAVRDPHGFRPLVLGRLPSGGWVVASETCAFDLIGATYVREVLPGEVLFIDQNGVTSMMLDPAPRHAFCIFEHVYFARPDSVVFGESVHMVRKMMGRQLARDYPVDADLVMAIPDSGNSAALGYAEESGIPLEIGMTRNHYVGRTFIQPEQHIRDLAVKVKLNPIKAVLKDKRVVVVDDSLVRGTTSKQRIEAIRSAGAKEIHLRISSAPIVAPCHFGIDTPNKNQLIANHKSIRDILAYVGADSIGYLTPQGMVEAVTAYQPPQFCTACFTGKYPLDVRDKGKFAMGSRKIKLYAETKGH